MWNADRRDLPIPGGLRHAAPLEEAAEPDGIARAVEGLLDDDERREGLARDGREWVVAHHASDTVAATPEVNSICETLKRTAWRWWFMNSAPMTLSWILSGMVSTDRTP